MYLYNIFGFFVESDFIIPGIEESLREAKLLADFVIRKKTNFKILEGKIENKISFSDFEVIETQNYISVNNKISGRIYISKSGDHIVFDDTVQAQNLNSVMHTGLSVCMILKSIIPVHAGAFLFDNEIKGIIANGGVGKSTMIWNCMKYGAKFVTDDILPISLCNNECIAHPSINVKPKLSINTIDYFGIQYDKNERVNSSKYWISVPRKDRLLAKKNINELYILSPYSDNIANKNYKIECVTTQREKVEKIINYTLCFHMMPLAYKKKVYSKISELCNFIDLYIIRYHKSFKNLDTITNEILLSKI